MQVDPTPVRVAFTSLPDLAGELVGGRVVWCDDDFFAGAENLVKRSIPVWDADAFTEHGKWMDGWESQRARRRNRASDALPCDTAIVALGMPGEIVGVDVNTAHFLGNAPQTVQLHAIELEPGGDAAGAPEDAWTELAGRTSTLPGTRNLVPVEPSARGRRFTHVRLRMFPDGGVARLRVHGRGIPAASALDGEIDLAAAANGASAVTASDQFFGEIANLILPGESQRMDEGWETRRTRDRVHDDWVVVRLAAPGRVSRVLVDTAHFRGNAPDAVRLEGAMLGADAERLDLATDPVQWRTLVPTSDVGPDARHEFEVDPGAGVVDHVRLVIEPDGGIARLRVWGTVA